MNNAGTPLTFAQESIYFLNDLTNGRPVYHMPQAFRLRGPLDAGRLEAAIQQTVERHEALRTAIVDRGEGPVQEPQTAFFRMAAHHASEASLMDQIAASIEAPFDLAAGRPFRADLFCIGPEDHVLLLNLHHVLGDMTSLGVLFGDIAAGYVGTVV